MLTYFEYRNIVKIEYTIKTTQRKNNVEQAILALPDEWRHAQQAGPLLA